MNLDEAQLVTLSGEEMAGWFKTPKFIRALDPTDKNSVVRSGLRAIDPTSKSSVTRSVFRELDPTAKGSSMSNILSIATKAAGMVNPQQEQPQYQMAPSRSMAPQGTPQDFQKYIPMIGAGLLAVALLKKKRS